MRSRIRIIGIAFWTLLFLLICSSVAGAWWVFLSDSSRVTEIEIRGNAFIEDAELQEMLAPLRLKGRHIWLTDFKMLEKELESYPRIKKAEIEKIPPGKLVVTLREEKEFATLVLLDGFRVTISSDGFALRRLKDDEPPVGPVIKGFSANVLEHDIPLDTDLEAEAGIWSGMTTEPGNAGKFRLPGVFGALEGERELSRFNRALKLAEATWIDRRPDLAGYDFIGLDANYDLFISYHGIPPIILGGYLGGVEQIADLASILNYDEPRAWEKYDYIDLHLPGYGRGIILAELETDREREWSDGMEAVRVAFWEALKEMERRS